MSSTSSLYSGAAEYHSLAPTMSLSPFAFEHDLNIDFRKTLQGRPHLEITKEEKDNAEPLSPPQSQHEANRDGSNMMSPSMNYGIATLTASPPDTSATSTPSTNYTDIWSNTSLSPESNSSVDFPFTPSRSSSPTMPSAPPGYRCSTCGETFRLQGELNKHRNRRHVKRFRCQIQGCEAAFHLKADLTRHTKSKHEDHVGIPCEHEGCLETFSRKDNMMRHMKEEHKQSKRKRARLKTKSP
jgi:hypothetical protein